MHFSNKNILGIKFALKNPLKRQINSYRRKKK